MMSEPNSAPVVEKTADFPAAFAAARASGKPSILHLKIDPEAITPSATLSSIREKSLGQSKK
jgi:acetolactate synthase-1/2/3 large subunit